MRAALWVLASLVFVSTAIMEAVLFYGYGRLWAGHSALSTQVAFFVMAPVLLLGARAPWVRGSGFAFFWYVAATFAMAAHGVVIALGGDKLFGFGFLVAAASQAAFWYLTKRGEGARMGHPEDIAVDRIIGEAANPVGLGRSA